MSETKFHIPEPGLYPILGVPEVIPQVRLLQTTPSGPADSREIDAALACVEDWGIELRQKHAVQHGYELWGLLRSYFEFHCDWRGGIDIVPQVALQDFVAAIFAQDIAEDSTLAELMESTRFHTFVAERMIHCEAFGTFLYARKPSATFNQGNRP